MFIKSTLAVLVLAASQATAITLLTSSVPAPSSTTSTPTASNGTSTSLPTLVPTSQPGMPMPPFGPGIPGMPGIGIPMPPFEPGMPEIPGTGMSPFNPYEPFSPFGAGTGSNQSDTPPYTVAYYDSSLDAKGLSAFAEEYQLIELSTYISTLGGQEQGYWYRLQDANSVQKVMNATSQLGGKVFDLSVHNMAVAQKLH